MKFSDKLPKLRKSNNYSQEQLAEKLEVSRQAVAKWESGDSYPDMERMLQICKVLNCHLNELIDDGVIGDSPTEPATNKSFSAYLKDFLDFITKSYTMFCCLKFKDKMKLLFEMAGICLVLLVVVVILNTFLYIFLSQILGGSDIAEMIVEFVTWVVTLALCVVSAVIVLHLFKIRHLDYFVLIEDQNATEKKVEAPITEVEMATKSSTFLEKPKEKIVIRDAKHSTWKFFDFLGKIILLMVKGLVILFVALPAIVGFISCAIGAAGSIYHTIYNWLFFWLTWLFVGGGLLCYVALEWVCNFVFNQKQHPKKLFILIIAGLAGIGIGIAIPTCIFLNFGKAPALTADDYAVKTEIVVVDDKTLFYCERHDVDCQIVTGTDGMVIEMTTRKVTEAFLAEHRHNDYVEYYPTSGYVNMLDIYQLVMADLKQGQIGNYNFGEMTVKATMSPETLERLRVNQLELEAEIAALEAQELEERMKNEEVLLDMVMTEVDGDIDEGENINAENASESAVVFDGRGKQ